MLRHAQQASKILKSLHDVFRVDIPPTTTVMGEAYHEGFDMEEGIESRAGSGNWDTAFTLAEWLRHSTLVSTC